MRANERCASPLVDVQEQERNYTNHALEVHRIRSSGARNTLISERAATPTPKHIEQAMLTKQQLRQRAMERAEYLLTIITEENTPSRVAGSTSSLTRSRTDWKAALSRRSDDDMSQHFFLTQQHVKRGRLSQTPPRPQLKRGDDKSFFEQRDEEFRSTAGQWTTEVAKQKRKQRITRTSDGRIHQGETTFVKPNTMLPSKPLKARSGRNMYGRRRWSDDDIEEGIAIRDGYSDGYPESNDDEEIIIDAGPPLSQKSTNGTESEKETETERRNKRKLRKQISFASEASDTTARSKKMREVPEETWERWNEKNVSEFQRKLRRVNSGRAGTGEAGHSRMSRNSPVKSAVFGSPKRGVRKMRRGEMEEQTTDSSAVLTNANDTQRFEEESEEELVGTEAKKSGRKGTDSGTTHGFDFESKIENDIGDSNVMGTTGALESGRKRRSRVKARQSPTCQSARKPSPKRRESERADDSESDEQEMTEMGQTTGRSYRSGADSEQEMTGRSRRSHRSSRKEDETNPESEEATAQATGRSHRSHRSSRKENETNQESEEASGSRTGQTTGRSHKSSRKEGGTDSEQEATSRSRTGQTTGRSHKSIREENETDPEQEVTSSTKEGQTTGRSHRSTRHEDETDSEQEATSRSKADQTTGRSHKSSRKETGTDSEQEATSRSKADQTTGRSEKNGQEETGTDLEQEILSRSKVEPMTGRNHRPSRRVNRESEHALTSRSRADKTTGRSRTHRHTRRDNKADSEQESTTESKTDLTTGRSRKGHAKNSDTDNDITTVRSRTDLEQTTGRSIRSDVDDIDMYNDIATARSTTALEQTTGRKKDQEMDSDDERTSGRRRRRSPKRHPSPVSDTESPRQGRNNSDSEDTATARSNLEKVIKRRLSPDKRRNQKKLSTTETEEYSETESRHKKRRSSSKRNTQKHKKRMDSDDYYTSDTESETSRKKRRSPNKHSRRGKSETDETTSTESVHHRHNRRKYLSESTTTYDSITTETENDRRRRHHRSKHRRNRRNSSDYYDSYYSYSSDENTEKPLTETTPRKVETIVDDDSYSYYYYSYGYYSSDAPANEELEASKGRFLSSRDVDQGSLSYTDTSTDDAAESPKQHEDSSRDRGFILPLKEVTKGLGFSENGKYSFMEHSKLRNTAEDASDSVSVNPEDSGQIEETPAIGNTATARSAVKEGEMSAPITEREYETGRSERLLTQTSQNEHEFFADASDNDAEQISGRVTTITKAGDATESTVLVQRKEEGERKHRSRRNRKDSSDESDSSDSEDRHKRHSRSHKSKTHRHRKHKSRTETNRRRRHRSRRTRDGDEEIHRHKHRRQKDGETEKQSPTPAESEKKLEESKITPVDVSKTNKRKYRHKSRNHHHAHEESPERTHRPDQSTSRSRRRRIPKETPSPQKPEPVERQVKEAECQTIEEEKPILEPVVVEEEEKHESETTPEEEQEPENVNEEPMSTENDKSACQEEETETNNSVKEEEADTSNVLICQHEFGIPFKPPPINSRTILRRTFKRRGYSIQTFIEYHKAPSRQFMSHHQSFTYNSSPSSIRQTYTPDTKLRLDIHSETYQQLTPTRTRRDPKFVFGSVRDQWNLPSAHTSPLVQDVGTMYSRFMGSMRVDEEAELPATRVRQRETMVPEDCSDLPVIGIPGLLSMRSVDRVIQPPDHFKKFRARLVATDRQIRSREASSNSSPARVRFF